MTLPDSSLRPDDGGGVVLRSFAALKWSYLGAAARVLSQLVVGIILARLLGPEPFGLVALAWIVVGFCNLLADIGFATALVQRRDVAVNDERYVFTMQLMVSILLSVAVFLSADLFATFYRRPDAVPVLKALSVLFIFHGLGQVSSSLLKRRLDFKAVQQVQVISYLLAYLGIGVTMAVLGFGVWSLVAAALTQGALGSLLFFRAAPHSMRPLWRVRGRGYMGFGLRVMGSNLCNYTINNVDSVVIGRAFGVAELGLYNRSLQLVLTPMSAVLVNLMAVLMPAYARCANDLQGVRHAYLASISVVAMVCIPPFLAAAAIPETIMAGLYGAKWVAASALLPPLAIATIATALLGVAGPVLVGTGHPGLEFKAQGASAVLMVCAMLWASTQSLQVLVWTVTVVFWIRFVIVTYAALSVSQGRWSDVAAALRGPLMLAVVAAFVVFVLDTALQRAGLPAVARLPAVVGAGLVTCIAFAYLFARLLATESVRWLVRRLEKKLPSFLVARMSVDI